MLGVFMLPVYTRPSLSLLLGAAEHTYCVSDPGMWQHCDMGRLCESFSRMMGNRGREEKSKLQRQTLGGGGDKERVDLIFVI